MTGKQPSRGETNATATILTLLSAITLLTTPMIAHAQGGDETEPTLPDPDEECLAHADAPEKTGVNCFEDPPPGFSCTQAFWGIHTEFVTIGGNHGCNIQAWANANALPNALDYCTVYTDAPDKTGIECFKTTPDNIGCHETLWGVHADEATLGGNDSCNVQAWANASQATQNAPADACTVHDHQEDKTGVNCFETPPPGMGCAQVLWGIHTDTATVGGNHSCNVQAWTNAEAAS